MDQNYFMRKTADHARNLGVLRSKLRDYYSLTKPEVNLLILMTTSAGFYLGSHTPLRMVALINTALGTLLIASGTATLNQWMERVWDGRMRRTAKRAIPAGRVSAREAFVFGGLLSIGGGFYLALTVNALSSLLATSTMLSYLLIYTPLKRKTPLCTLLGAIPGAMPTLIGWTGATNSISAQAWFLFAILFLWQFPHFLSIALMYREDYARAGYHMLPLFDQDSRFTRAEIVAFAVVLVATTLLPATTRGAPAYFAVMALAGVFLLHHVVKVARSASPVVASRLLHASVLYLPVVLGTLVAFKP
jgi:protoheme IX farnesyltransferase